MVTGSPLVLKPLPGPSDELLQNLQSGLKLLVFVVWNLCSLTFS